MDSIKKEEVVTLEQYEMSDSDSIPLWAVTLFSKMKTEICAEVHAKVAYSMRIMLDQFHEDLKKSFHEPTDGNCSCRELNKCSEKLAALCGSHKQAKEETKKRLKRIQQEIKKSNKLQKNVSESDTDNEKNLDTTPSSQKYDPSIKVAPPIPPRKTNSLKSLVQTDHSYTPDAAILSENRQELINGPTEMLNIKEHSPEFQLCNSGKHDLGVQCNSSIEQKLQNQEIPVLQTSEIFSPSDSEFEVISLPTNPVSEYARLPREMPPLISDYDDNCSSCSNDDFETENYLEFKDCKSIDDAISQTSGGTLYPALELKKMSLSMSMNSSTNTLLDGYMSSTEGAVALEPFIEPAVMEIERERAPYCVPPEVVEQINQQEIVHSQPLPSEFLRDRLPYSHVQLEESNKQAQKPLPQIPKVSRPPQQYQRDSTYRMDNLPESLWDEALTVAAQTYNAAKTAVGNLADTFVPGVPTQVSTASPQPRNSPVRTQPVYRVEMASKEKTLYEMGFSDHGLNATLLIRHNGDMGRVIAELIEPM